MKDYTLKKAKKVAAQLVRASGKKISKENLNKIIQLLKNDFTEQLTKKYSRQ